MIKKNIREIDLAARYGPERFAVVLPYADRKIAAGVCERICDIFTHPLPDQASLPLEKIAVHLAFCISRSDISSTEELMQKVEEAL